METQMPSVSEQHKKMAELAGTWIGEDTLMPSPWLPAGATAVGNITARLALGEFHLIVDWAQSRDGKLHFEGHGVLGWDSRGKCYTMHWFDSIGAPPKGVGTGRWEGDCLTLDEASPMGHHRHIHRFEGDRTYHFRIETSQDGQFYVPMMEGQYTRQ